tara:strand:+ start:1220 stop:1522 length:303 start_codon:yes stop_codon:yes gene_type:complete
MRRPKIRSNEVSRRRYWERRRRVRKPNQGKGGSVSPGWGWGQLYNVEPGDCHGMGECYREDSMGSYCEDCMGTTIASHQVPNPAEDCPCGWPHCHDCDIA